MLDIKFIRKNPEVVEKKVTERGIDIDINYILKLDRQFRDLSSSVQKLREEKNVFNEKIRKNPSQLNKEEAQSLKQKLEKEEGKLKTAEKDLHELMFKIPNLALPEVPVGDETKNEIIKKVEKPPKFNFAPKDHLELGESLDIIDVKRAAKVSGTRFGYLKNEAVLLEFALVQFVLDKLTKEGFIPVIPPALILKEITDGLGYWHGKIDKGHTANENYYLVHDPQEHAQGLYLVGTGEHSVVPMHRDEVFREQDLPKRYIVFSPCFRMEAGSYGKDTRGIFRVHEFDKLEMVSFVKPEDDKKERDKLLFLAESMMKDLGLSYQLVRLASGDLGFPTAETIDIETWIPSQKKYRETHSISTTTDFQARRLNVKYQDGGEKKYVHILNGTAFAIGRTIIAILENYQQKDGSVEIPKVLQKYIGKTSIKPQK